MEIRVNLNLIAAIACASLLVPFPSDAYSRATHKGISDAILRTFENQRGDIFTAEQEAALIQGSWDEDDDWRFMRHFFDPVNQAGLFRKYEPSKYWAQNTEAQANYECVGAWVCYGDRVRYTDSYFSSPTDFSWDRAVYEYAWGDKIRGAAALGHIIHLLQDATVPAHVRNDAHPSGFGVEFEADPYEKYTATYQLGSISALKQLNTPTFKSLGDSFDLTASFTNSNFLSRDSIDAYSNPSLSKLTISGGYGRNLDLGVRIASARSVLDRKANTYKTELFFEKGDDSVSEDYWRVLSKKAIESGVGVIDLFLREVEKEKQAGVLKAKNTSAAERRAKENAKKYFGIVKTLYGSSLNQGDVEELLSDGGNQVGAAAAALTTGSSELRVESAPAEKSESDEVRRPVERIVENTTTAQEPSAPQSFTASSTISTTTSATSTSPAMQELVPVVPGFGGGGGGGGGSSESEPATPPPVFEPVGLTVASPLSGSFFATTTVTFTGSTEASGLLSLESSTSTATTTADASGNWSADMVLDEGNPTITVRATDNTGERATSTSVSIFVDVTPPSLPTVSLPQCADSLAASFCLLATTSVSVDWTDVSDAAYYALAVDAVTGATTTATSSIAIVGYGATSSISVIAYDAAGNSATSTSELIFAIERPVVINEIAWAGTDASATDEWIELKNISNYDIDLSKVVLYIDFATTSLSGTASRNSLYLIEDRAESTNKSHDHIYDMDLPDTGTQVSLADTEGSVFDTSPVISACAGWCAGSTAATVGHSEQFGNLTAKLSMERIDSTTDGAASLNWRSNDTYIRLDSNRATDSASGSVYGTPRMENSSVRPSAGWSCGDGILTTVGGTYAPSSSFCTYYSAFISTRANRYGVVYKGTIGTSTSVSGHSMSKSILKDENDGGIVSSAAAGDQYFVAIFEVRNGPAFNTEVADFNAYFQTGTGSAPHSNYVTIPWTYAP